MTNSDWLPERGRGEGQRRDLLENQTILFTSKMGKKISSEKRNANEI